MSKLPLRAWDRVARTFARVAPCHHVARVFRRAHRIFASANAAAYEMAERDIVQRFGGHQIAPEQPGYRLAVILGNRSVKPQGILAGCIPLPTQRHDSETIVQK